jgi:2-oxoisovalerate dehydrogenase E2 component (dihydrolipoyl transacylase)
MDTPRGLLVPVIQQVQNKSVFDIAEVRVFSFCATCVPRVRARGYSRGGPQSFVRSLQALAELQALGLAGKLGEEHLAGGTISVSNMGSIGGLSLSPVITSPQVAIVALGRIQTLPRFDAGGRVAATKVMAASWAGDHRVVDGATMARFVNVWKRYLEHPALMLALLK